MFVLVGGHIRIVTRKSRDPKSDRQKSRGPLEVPVVMWFPLYRRE